MGIPALVTESKLAHVPTRGRTLLEVVFGFKVKFYPFS